MGEGKETREGAGDEKEECEKGKGGREGGRKGR